MSDLAADLDDDVRLWEELQKRRTCRTSFLSWCTEALAPFGQAPAAHHRLLIKELEGVIRGDTRRLMVNMPPGSAKSTYGSVLFPAWALAQRASIDMIGASNTAQMAEGFSRRVQAQVREYGLVLGYSLGREAAEQWDTTLHGQYRAVGIGGAIVGARADCVIIDDPTRSRQDAESLTVRESQWAWFTSDLRTRLKPDAAIVVIMTRWHMDDLGGRLLERQPGLWRVVSLPAIAEDNDALGREPGEWLWGDDAYGYSSELQKVYAEYEAAGESRDWAALYQQRPRPLEGSLFKTGNIGILDALPAGGITVRAWDLAATAKTGTRNPDWTVGLKMTRLPEGRFIVSDVRRLRGGPDEIEALIVNTAMQDGKAIKIGLPQDPGQAGKAQVLYLTRKLFGCVVESSPETGAKETRAAPFASQVNAGNVCLVRGSWNAAFIDELASFPSGTHDDQPDASSRAFSMLTSYRGPATQGPLRL